MSPENEGEQGKNIRLFDPFYIFKNTNDVDMKWNELKT